MVRKLYTHQEDIMSSQLQAFSIDGTRATLDYDDYMFVSNITRAVIEIELAPDADYVEFSRAMQYAAHLFTLGFEAANPYDHEDIGDVPCDDDGLPGTVSMRMSALRDFGGDLRNLWDSPRFDSCGHHRSRRISATKERRGYRPWQSNKQQALISRLFN
jgi:hypothetical protein